MVTTLNPAILADTALVPWEVYGTIRFGLVLIALLLMIGGDNQAFRKFGQGP